MPTQRQRALHEFFAPSVDLTEAELLDHRREVTARFPSLLHQVGRALAAIRRSRDGQLNSGSTVTDGTRTIVAHALVRPDPDYRKMINALMRRAIQQELKRQDDHPDEVAPHAA